MSLAEFFHMGGYAFYVWGSYGIAFIVLLLNLFLPQYQHRQQLRKLTRRHKQMEQNT